MTVGDGGCRPGTAKTPSSADNGRPAVIHMLGRDGRSWRRPVRPGKITDGTAVPGRRTGRLRSLASRNQPVQIVTNKQSVCLSRPCPACLQPARLDCLQPAQRQPVQILSSLPPASLSRLCSDRPSQPVSIVPSLPPASQSRSCPTSRELIRRMQCINKVCAFRE